MTFVDGRQHDFWRVDEARLRAALAADRPARRGSLSHVLARVRTRSASSVCSRRSQTPTVIEPRFVRVHKRLVRAADGGPAAPPRLERRPVTARTRARAPGTSPRPPSRGCPSTCGPSPRWPSTAPPPARSEELAAAAGVNSAKLRKDLSYLGSYGTRGVGYDVDYLRYQIAREIGVTQDWPVVIVGIGNLGHALANYSGFRSRGFRVVALLDADPERHDEVRRRHRRARPSTTSSEIVAEHGVAIGVIATPASAAQDVADRMVAARHQQHPQLRARRARGPRRRRRPQGRPVHRAADPGLPRAAQGPGAASRMSVLVVGISHNSAPVALLERVALDGDGVPKLVHDVAAVRARHRGHGDLHLQPARDLRRRRPLPRLASRSSPGCWSSAPASATEAMLPHLYVHYDDGAVSHLFQVAAGLDSMAVGEGQILGQTREALRLGQELGTVGPALNVLFQQALRVGKRSRAETDIDRAAPSLVSRRARPRPTPAVGDASPGTRVAGRRGRRDGRAGHRHGGPARRRRGHRGQPHRRSAPIASPRSTAPARRRSPTCRPSSPAPTW